MVQTRQLWSDAGPYATKLAAKSTGIVLGYLFASRTTRLAYRSCSVNGPAAAVWSGRASSMNGSHQMALHRVAPPGSQKRADWTRRSWTHLRFEATSRVLIGHYWSFVASLGAFRRIYQQHPPQLTTLQTRPYPLKPFSHQPKPINLKPLSHHPQPVTPNPNTYALNTQTPPPLRPRHPNPTSPFTPPHP